MSTKIDKIPPCPIPLKNKKEDKEFLYLAFIFRWLGQILINLKTFLVNLEFKSLSQIIL